MVRVGSLFDVAALQPNEIDNKSGMTPQKQLEKIYAAVPALIALKKRLYVSVMKDLAAYGVCDCAMSALSPEETKFAVRHYRANIMPLLSPIIISSRHPIPHLANKRLYAAALLRDKKGRCSVGIVPIPNSLPPYLKLRGEGLRFVRTESIIADRLGALFGIYRVEERCVVCVTRNADVSFDDEKFEDSETDFRLKVTKLLKKRDNLAVVRLETDRKISDDFLQRLSAIAGVEKRQTFEDGTPLKMDYVYSLSDDLSAEKAEPLLYAPYKPRYPEDIRKDLSVISQVERRDKLLFYPYDSVEPFMRLLSEAAERTDVVSIKISIYRLASTSKIARVLCRAAENGKEVVVLMELRARFDEANNVAWSKILEEAGCQVVYGAENFKCHSKICLVTIRSKGKTKYITQIGTGNYNEKTNAMYTDLSLLTADGKIGEDASAFFRNMLVNNLEGKYAKLLSAPHDMKQALLSLIDEQTALGTEGYICIKVNSITEREVIDKLAQASGAGVEVRLIVRGVCCILPRVSPYTDNLSVTGVIGRYLEHARIYRFGRGESAKFFISSADLMTRNLNRRVEIACPINDCQVKKTLSRILDIQLADNVKAWKLNQDGSYTRKKGKPAVDSQKEFTETSLHEEQKRQENDSSLLAECFEFVKKLRSFFVR